MRSFILALALISSVSAQALEDVIYKKDGTVLRGSLIEQDFENGRYKIQLQGGSIFAVSKDEITKISKEAPLNNTVNNDGGVNINIENNPVITQSPTQSNQQTSTLQTYGYTSDQAIEKRHSIRIGHMRKNITDSDDDGISYTGFDIAYQYNLDENIAFYTEFHKGDFDGFIADGEVYDYYDSGYDGLSFTGIEASALLSTNNYQGWQFYAGLGVFQESYELPGSSNDASGVVFTLGMGYSWQTVQLHFKVAGHGSDDYGDDVSSSNTTLQLAFNY